MSPLASRRTLAAASSLVLAAIGLTGCISLPGGGGGSSSSDISKMKNIPEGIKQDLISQLNSASSSEKKEILEKATALNNVVGTQLIAVDPSIASGQKYKLDPKGMVTVDKNEDVYLVMSGAVYWRLGQDSYDLCVDQDCQYYSSWTIDTEGNGSNLVYVWTLKIDNPEVTDQPLVRRFRVGK